MFKTRLASGIVLIMIAVLSLSLGGLVLAGVLLLISLIGYRELTKALKVTAQEKKWNALEGIGLAGAVIYYLLVTFVEADIWKLMCIVGVFLAMLFVYVVLFPQFQAEQCICAFFAFLYAPVMLSFIYLTRAGEMGVYLVWLILISSWGSDTCAYAVGMLIGKKKIFPVLSPKKSLEGCIGGVLGSALLGGLYGWLVVGPTAQEMRVALILAFVSAVGSVMSQIGDLAASAIKRNHNIKDYGKLIPGHGGIMDRFDSVIVTAPMIYLLAIILL